MHQGKAVLVWSLPAFGVKSCLRHHCTADAVRRTLRAPATSRRRCFRRSWRGRVRCSIRRSSRARCKAFVREAESGDADEEPGDVRRRGRRRADDAVPRPRHRHRRRRRSASSCRSRSGSGSRCCSPTSPKRWRKRAARRRPNAAQDEDRHDREPRCCPADEIEQVPASTLRAGDVVICRGGRPDSRRRRGDRGHRHGRRIGDHRRERAGDPRVGRRPQRRDRRHQVLSDQIKIKITSNPGETFLDRMIALVEGAERQKTPNEIALNILIAGLTLIFLLAVVTLLPLRRLQRGRRPAREPCRRVAVLVSLLVCLIPTTIGGLLSAIGIAGMDRVMQHNVLAMSGKAVEAAGDVNTLLLDKTGTITLGNRQAVEFLPRRRRHRRRAGRRGAAVQPGRRDAGRPLDRRAGEGEVRPARPRGRGTRRATSFRSRPTRA